MKPICHAILLVFCAFFLSACQSIGLFSSDEYIDPNSLAALQPAVLSIKRETSATLSLKDLIDSYTKLLPMLQDPDAQMKVLHRLADLKLQKGEQLMAEQAVDELNIAISAYQGLLTKYPERQDNDHVLYQLAKTYDLKGMQDAHLETLDRLISEYPASKYFVEVQFRRGEILFTYANYPAAQSAFESVINAGESVFQANAYYMLGWSQFKQSAYQTALVSYTEVLDLLLLENRQDDLTQLNRISQKHKTLIKDLLRVMGLSFSYLGGADSLVSLFKETGSKDYETLVYQSYGKLLLDKEQYSDVIDVYKSFIKVHPLSIWAPDYQMTIIETLKVAGFKRDIIDEKVRFVESYGLSSEYWPFHHKLKEKEAHARALSFVKEQLEKIVPELADLHYVKAQRALKKKNQAIVKKEFALSAHYNQVFVETFPQHKQAAQRYFLLGEAELQLTHWVLAITAFEKSGYGFEHYANAAEAAYASILAYKKLAKTWLKKPKEQYQGLLEQQQKSRLRFVKKHGDDKRALGVLFIATTYNFKTQQYDQAIQHAQQVIDWPAPFVSNLVNTADESATSVASSMKAAHPQKADKKTLLEAYLIKAHSLYAKHDYLLAEPVYKTALSKLPKKDKRRASLIENLAACVFKQAETLLADGKKSLAVDEFLRVGIVAPASLLRSSAEYDAASYLFELKRWPKMIKVLTEFRQRYPKHALKDTLPAKLALAYRETKQWELAADELQIMYALAKTKKEKKETLYIVAELYDKAENNQQAILSYRKYANTYPQPVEVYMEAANRLAELYEQTNKPLKRRFWLAKQMKRVDQAPDKADDRMRYLAASASSVLANDAFIQYKRIKLSLPLNKTMIKKTAALTKAMTAFQKTASYGVSEFSTEAGYRMADIYAQLSVDLMDSDRPGGLNELELEQYEILLEEQSFPFEDSAIDIHEQNASRSWNGLYDAWVKNSFKALRELLPGRYAKDEVKLELVHDLF